MKCFERLVMDHINTIIPETLDTLQFLNCPNRSTDDEIYIALHTALSHLDKRNNYVRMLLISSSSVFNTIVPTKLITKLRTLGLNTSQNLSLNVSKTKELIVDYSKRRVEQALINIDGAEVERVESFKFLGVHITNELSWSKHTKTVVKRARQHLFPLRRLKRFGMGPTATGSWTS